MNHQKMRSSKKNKLLYWQISWKIIWVSTWHKLCQKIEDRKIPKRSLKYLLKLKPRLKISRRKKRKVSQKKREKTKISWWTSLAWSWRRSCSRKANWETTRERLDFSPDTSPSMPDTLPFSWLQIFAFILLSWSNINWSETSMMTNLKTKKNNNMRAHVTSLAWCVAATSQAA